MIYEGWLTVEFWGDTAFALDGNCEEEYDLDEILKRYDGCRVRVTIEALEPPPWK